MILHSLASSQCRRDARFCLFWGIVTGFGTMYGIISGLAAATAVGLFVYLLTRPFPALSGPLLLILPVAAVGVVVGAVSSFLQSYLLPWSQEARDRWILRNIWGWGAGAGVGTLVAVLADPWLPGASGPLLSTSTSRLMVLMTPLLGMVLGLALWLALPVPRPNRLLWLAANVVAASAGWIAAWPMAPSSDFLALTWQGLVLGPLVYTAITATLMTWVERRRAITSEITDESGHE